jgi:hypothetical protein
MKTPHLGFPLAALAFALALAPAATAQEAEEAVPPGNSAVNQYTEPFPSAGGERDVHEQEGRQGSPRKVLGPRNARRLEREGGAGRALARLTAETAPPPSAGSDEAGQTETATGPGGGNGGQGGDEGGREIGSQNSTARGGEQGVEIADVSGSSGLGAVLARAIGVSPSGVGGLLLPLLILTTLVWAIAYAFRQRQTAA